MLEELLCNHAEQRPQAVAFRILREGRYRAWTFSAVWQEARSAAGWLREHGIAAGDRVALWAENSPEWALAYLGIYLAGAVVVPLDAQYTERELQTILGFAGCKLMLCSEGKKAVAQTIIPQVRTIDGDSPFFKATPIPVNGIGRRPEELMAVIYTSGTTGDPKGVCLSVGNIFSNLQAILKLNLVTIDDTLLALLPFHHCYSLTTSVLLPLVVGGSATLCLSLRGPDMIAAMRDTNITVVLGVPKLFEGLDRAILDKVRLASSLKQRTFRSLTGFSRKVRRWTGLNPGKILFRSIHRTFGKSFRFFVSGGAKLDPAIAERFLDLGIKVVEGYGLTEMAPVVSFNPVNRIKPGTVGVPLSGVEVKIDNPNSEGVGEIIVRGPNIMLGYDRRPQDTAEVIRNGWFFTGDLGFIDAEGYISITGRAKEVIVLSSGKNIYPEDLERYYEKSPIVKEICAMPVELTDGRVERLCAVVVPESDELRRIKATSVYDALHQEITTLSQGLPTYMRVTDLKIVTNEFPRTRLGKLRRAEIRRMVFDEVAEAVSVLSPADQALLALPLADRLLARLRDLTRYEGEILPRHNLELDLGIDSLSRIELGVILEQEFGMTIPPDQAVDINTVGDLLKRLSADATQAAGRASWREILQNPVSPSLSELFNLQRGRLRQGSLNLLRGVALGLSKELFPLDVRGLENVPTDKPYLLCPSHSSLLDSILVYLVLPDDLMEKTFFLGAAEYFESALMRWLGRAGRVIPTATSDTVLTSLRRAAEVLRLGKTLCIFPEGHITRDGFLQRPRPGAAILACELGVPIVPVLVRGTYEILSYAHPGFRFRPVGLTFGPAILPPVKEKYENADYAALMNTWQQTLIRLRLEDDASGSRTAGKSPRIKESLLC
jgi:long-chain acyl-CoA synthetase